MENKELINDINNNVSEYIRNIKEKYAQEKSKNHVAWEERKQTKSIRFYAEVGNNILLLWDSLQEK